jgi:hypothetical protein
MTPRNPIVLVVCEVPVPDAVMVLVPAVASDVTATVPP